MGLVEKYQPEPSDEEIHARIQLAIKECNKFGLTGVHDAGISDQVTPYLLSNKFRSYK